MDLTKLQNCELFLFDINQRIADQRQTARNIRTDSSGTKA